jgi:AcrR family transcriptional regulator
MSPASAPAQAPARYRRLERRARIEQAALELFRRHGFDAVTVEDVCARAGVGPATFYRHFGTKEEVVVGYEEQFTAALRSAVAAAGAGEAGRLERLSRILTAFACYLQTQEGLLAVRDEIVLPNPPLLRRTLAVQRALEAELAAGLARLRGLVRADDAAVLDAALGMAVLRTAMRAWRDRGGPPLPEATTRALADARTLFRG